MPGWFEEVDLDPTSTWRRMGTRSLGARPWLVADDRRGAELALKAHLLATRREEVLRSSAPHAAAAADVRRLVEDEGVTIPAVADDLEAAARSVQEDLCLLQRHERAWHLDAACVCFPSRWRLADKIGRPLVDVHGPTPGYADHLDRSVTSLLDRLGPGPVVRRNWFVHPDASLFQPSEPTTDPIVAAADVAFGLHLRSERQTLRGLPSGWVLFAIRVQQEPIGEAAAHPGWRERFVTYLRQAAPDDLAHRGMQPAQVEELLVAFG